MATSPFKSFIPYLIKTALIDDGNLQEFESIDPSGALWTTKGFVPPLPGEYRLHVNLETGGKLLCVQINDRILPGKVRDEELKKRVANLEAAEARKVSKKEYAQLRDEVEFELLPKAFIRRTKVYVCVMKGQRDGENYMLVFTSSQKKADEVAALIATATGMPNPPWKIETDWSVVGRLTTLAKESRLFCDDDDGHESFEATDFAVLKGNDKQTIRIKDKRLVEQDIVDLLNTDYEVHEIGVEYTPLGHDLPVASFTVNHNLTFKRLAFPGVNKHEDLYAEAIFVMPNLRDLMGSFFSQQDYGGFGPLPAMPAPAASGSTSDDEL